MSGYVVPAASYELLLLPAFMIANIELDSLSINFGFFDDSATLRFAPIYLFTNIQSTYAHMIVCSGPEERKLRERLDAARSCPIEVC